MKNAYIPALAISALSVCLGAESTPQQSAPATKEAFSFNEWLPGRFKLFDAKRDHAENPWVQSVDFRFRPQYQWSYMDPAGGADRVKGGSAGKGRRGNDEWRRFRLGGKAKVLNRITLFTDWDIGGLNQRYKYSNGQWNRSRGKTSVYELYAQADLKPVTLTVGKMKPAYIGEYRTSDSQILTIERSNLVNQLTAEALYGIHLKNSDKKAKFGWEAGVYVNGSHDDLWKSPAFNSATNAMAAVGLSYATSDKSRLYLDYMHSFYNEDRKLPVGVAEEGPGARDIVALTWTAKRGNFSFMAEGMAGFNTPGASGSKAGAENVAGISLIPSYKLSKHTEAVFRYQLAAGSNAVDAYSRYATTNSAYSSVSDALQGFYFGVNYYVNPEKPDMMRVMLGAEYQCSSGKDATGAKGFTGWQYGAALRANF